MADPFKLSDWNTILDELNALINGSPPGCPKLTALKQVTSPHVLSYADVQNVQTALNTICSQNQLTLAGKQMWTESLFTNIRSAINRGWCGCGQPPVVFPIKRYIPTVYSNCNGYPPINSVNVLKEVLDAPTLVAPSFDMHGWQLGWMPEPNDSGLIINYGKGGGFLGEIIGFFQAVFDGTAPYVNYMPSVTIGTLTTNSFGQETWSPDGFVHNTLSPAVKITGITDIKLPEGMAIDALTPPTGYIVDCNDCGSQVCANEMKAANQQVAAATHTDVYTGEVNGIWLIAYGYYDN